MRFARSKIFTLIFLAIALCTSIIVSHTPTIATPTPHLAQVDNTAELIKAVNKMEQQWEKDYENYFRSDLSNWNKSAEAIAQELTKVAAVTGTRPAVLWAWHTDKGLDMAIITPGKPPQAYTTVDASSKKLLATINEFRGEITNPRKRGTTSYLAPAQQLYNWLIKPVEAQLQQEKIDTILFCVGGGLRSTPLAALHDGKKFLIEKYNIALIPAYNLISTDHQPLKNSQILAMGASEFLTLNPLPAVPVELSAITTNVWSGQSYLNQEFTLANLKNRSGAIARQADPAKPINIIHLATHAEFQPGEPKNSFIQLWGKEQLNLQEIQKLGWNNPPVELLVLSACRTALGDKNAELGFAGLAIQAGVKSALASLWYVSDAGTLALMTEFYQQLKISQIKSAALRNSQLQMIQNKLRVEAGAVRSIRGSVSLPASMTEEADTNLSHPYYWAAFTLIGNPW
ncbi:MAG: CHAT domain-containing protein [Microcoleaceae cyanobacterium]